MPDWVTDIEPAHRYRELPDGRKMWESRLTVTRAAIERMWQGYICAVCLEELTEAFPKRCPNDWCDFPIRSLQRKQLEQDFAGEVAQMRRENWIEREEAFLEEHFHVRRPH